MSSAQSQTVISNIYKLGWEIADLNSCVYVTFGSNDKQ